VFKGLKSILTNHCDVTQTNNVVSRNNLQPTGVLKSP